MIVLLDFDLSHDLNIVPAVSRADEALNQCRHRNYAAAT